MVNILRFTLIQISLVSSKNFEKDLQGNPGRNVNWIFHKSSADAKWEFKYKKKKHSTGKLWGAILSQVDHITTPERFV